MFSGLWHLARTPLTRPEPAVFDILTNPYKARRTWPPDFSRLSRQQQLRLEKKYKRRLKLQWARPRLQKSVTIIQWISVPSVIAYVLLYVDWPQNENQQLRPLREWVATKSGHLVQPFGTRTTTIENANPSTNS